MKTDKTKKNDFFKKTFLAICLVVVKNINKKNYYNICYLSTTTVFQYSQCKHSSRMWAKVGRYGTVI